MVLSFLSRLHPYTASRSPSRLPSGSLLDTIKSLSRFETIPIAGGSQSQHQPRTHWGVYPFGVNSLVYIHGEFHMHYLTNLRNTPNPASYISDLNVNQLESLATELSAYFTMLKVKSPIRDNDTRLTLSKFIKSARIIKNDSKLDVLA